ncbi:hypothetical protein ATB98_21975 [Sinorhizobium saheli]|uniref:Uncharacterized protein n=1 Tax=Sinorhizobium saheli TaxID=36856 RepID=A0A178YJ53_SINSA|nr:hypothetical protein ATB98_21975 [Sinorhizobium saheli]
MPQDFDGDNFSNMRRNRAFSLAARCGEAAPSFHEFAGRMHCSMALVILLLLLPYFFLEDALAYLPRAQVSSETADVAALPDRE